MGYFGGVGLILVRVLLGLALSVVVLRVLLPLVGARFRNPLCQLIYRATNPVLVPLGKLIPNVRNVSTAGIVLALIVATLGVVLMCALAGQMPGAGMLLVLGLGTLLHFTLMLLFWTIIVFALLSFVSADYSNPLAELVHSLATPILRPFRRLPPRMSGLDLSPLWACVTIQILDYTLAYLGLAGLQF